MLALTRRRGESIAIGDNIRVEVIAVNGSQVKLAIHAPRDVPILREEIAGGAASEPSSGGG